MTDMFINNNAQLDTPVDTGYLPVENEARRAQVSFWWCWGVNSLASAFPVPWSPCSYSRMLWDCRYVPSYVWRHNEQTGGPLNVNVRFWRVCSPAGGQLFKNLGRSNWNLARAQYNALQKKKWRGLKCWMNTLHRQCLKPQPGASSQTSRSSFVCVWLYMLNYMLLSFNYVFQIVYCQTIIITSVMGELQISKSRQKEIYFWIHQYRNHNFRCK